MKKEKILGINVCVTDYDQLLASIEIDIKNNNKSFIVAINPEKVLKAANDADLKKLLNSATYQIPDGIGIIHASKLKKGNIKSRITGIDLMDKLCYLSSKKNYKVFMYGAREEIVSKAKENLEKRYPNINIVGFLDGYNQGKDLTKIINKSKADILFVAMGSPKQEKFIIQNMDKLCPKVFQGVGGSFDVVSGNIKRAPIFMQKIGMEWLYRLMKEPKRIFRQLKILKFYWLIVFAKKSRK